MDHVLLQKVNMKTRDAVIHVLKEEGISKYKMAKDIGVQPIMINHYLNKCRMRQDTANRFQLVYGIEIDDVYPPKTVIEDV